MLKKAKKLLKRILGIYDFDAEYEKRMKKANELYHRGDKISRLRAKRLHNQNMIRFGCSIPPEVTLGKNFYVAHAGGIRVARRAVFGDNCQIYPNAHIMAAVKGDRSRYGANERRSAKIGNNVIIGADSRIIGRITIGDDVLIAACAIVTKDVPPHSVVKGLNQIRPKTEADYDTPVWETDSPEYNRKSGAKYK